MITSLNYCHFRYSLHFTFVRWGSFLEKRESLCNGKSIIILLFGIHRLEDVETGFTSPAFDGELFRVLGTVAGVELKRDVVLPAR